MFSEYTLYKVFQMTYDKNYPMIRNLPTHTGRDSNERL